MIYLNLNRTPQRIGLPVIHSDRVSGLGQCKFLLFSTTNRKDSVEYLLANNDYNNDYNADFAIVLQPFLSASGQFYYFDLVLPVDLPQKGEYTFALVSVNKGTLGTGVAQLGDYHSTKTEYEKTIEYKQYGA